MNSPWRALAATMFVVLAGCVWAVSAEADDARIEVATLDGAPVYHWIAFKSFVPDDIDRALILREFRRKAFQLPERLVDDAVQQEITGKYDSNSKKFESYLHENGVSMEEFKQFAAEEISIKAMLHQDAKTTAEQTRKRTDWLAGLRTSATIKRLPSKTGSGG